MALNGKTVAIPTEPLELHRITKSVSRQAMASTDLVNNIEKCRQRGLTKLEELPEHEREKGIEPLAMVAGGPTLADTLDELREFKHVMVCGSAHDYTVSQGINIRYAAIVDGDPLMARYIKRPQPMCTYLVATQCDDAVFDALEGYPIATWNCLGSVPEETFNEEVAYSGGSTVTLRALNIAIILGFKNLHMFGFDSCMADVPGRDDIKQHHAYGTEPVNGAYPLRVGENPGRLFYCAPYMVNQARHFQDWMQAHGKFLVDMTIHGDGLIAEIMRQGKKMADELSAEEWDKMAHAMPMQ